MENNNQVNYPNTSTPNNTYAGNAPYPTGTPVPEAPQYANPYGTPAPEAPQYADPYAPAPEAPQYADPYAPAPEAPQYADPYASAYPYGAPVVVPPKKSKKGLLIGLIAGGATLLVIIISLVLYFNSDSYKYGKAQDLMAEGNYIEALSYYRELGYYEDSEDKIIECSRRALYEYLVAHDGEVYVYDEEGDDKYGLTPSSSEDDRIVLFTLGDDDGFLLDFDLSTDDATFYYQWEDSYSRERYALGDCKISELTTDNLLDIDSYTGTYSTMKDLTNLSCDLACLYLPDILEETGLGITPADLGFSSLD